MLYGFVRIFYYVIWDLKEDNLIWRTSWGLLSVINLLGGLYFLGYEECLKDWTNLEKAYPVEAVLLGKEAGEIKSEIVTGHMQDKNTFEEPETVGVQGFDGVQATKEGISFTIPACSVLHIAVK